ncbi:MAG: ABC transporter ATP-binding protein [Clostridia bacterium]|nr:ABC transporter ATP-binding protein [Clostridia bacterium]
MEQTYVLEMQNIVKRFGKTLANDNVSLRVKQGEVHALIGENGAGKSTLMNILYGLIKPDSGSIVLQGKPLSLSSSKEAIKNGIGMVHQHFMLAPSLTVAENIVLGHPPTRSNIWKPSKLKKRLDELQSEFNFDVPLNAVTGGLTVGLMQRVEIIKTLYRGAKLIILDEPTAVLTPQEAEELFVSIRRLTKAGNTVIFISHKLKEVMEISDTITVMRAGKVIGTVKKEEVDAEKLAQMMIGRELAGVKRADNAAGDAMLSVQNFKVLGDDGLTAVDDMSFEVRFGEIVGIAGVEGNGQTELSEAILGVRRSREGKLFLSQEEVTNTSVENRLKKGLGFIAQDRVKEGLSLGFSIRDNLILKLRRQKPVSDRGIMHWKNASTLSREMIEAYSIKANSDDETVSSLSGGNMQKVVVARELSTKPKLVIACQPTRGVDIGASEYIRSMLVKLRDEGNAVLLISADLDEIMELSDRILVMFEGKKTGELLSADANERRIGRLMFGRNDEEETA